MIELTYNKGFTWKEEGNISYKGYFLPSKDFHDEADVLKALRKVNSLSDFAETLNSIDGCFSIVIKKDGEILIAADRIRSFPLFYDVNGKYISDKADTIRERLNINIKDTDDLLLSELRIKRNTESGHTVYADIMQLEPGQVVSVKMRNICKCFYYRHLQYGHIRTKNELEKQFEGVLDQTFSCLIDTLKGRKVIIPLSGGYDSRLIASMLKKKGIQDVLCYTYGRDEDYEVIYSRNVAQALGYDWEFVSYTENEWKSFLDDGNKDANEYFEDTHNHCTFPHLQDYIALKRLLEKRKIHPGDIVIPGFCGDFHAGSFTNLPETQNYDVDYLVDFTFKTHYVNLKNIGATENELKTSLKKYYLNLNYQICDRDTAICAYQEWSIFGRIAMWVVNSVRVYEHFGLEFRLPQWERVYIDFWYSVDNTYRKKCKFYREYLLNGLFKDYGIDFKKPEPRTIHNNPVKSKIATFIKYCLIFISVHLGRDFYRRNNINNYNYGAILLYKKLKNKRMFKYHSLSIHSMEDLWWSEKMYL